MKRRILSLLLCFLLCAGMFGARAAAVPTVMAEQVCAEPGEAVTAALLLSGNPGVSSLVFTVEYDPAALTLLHAAIDPVFASLPGATVLVNDLAAGRVVLSWLLTTGEADLDGAFAQLTFRAAEGISGDFPLTVSYQSGNVCDEALNNVYFDVVNGGVSIGVSEPQSAGTVAADRVSGAPGESVTAALTISDNPGVSSLMFAVEYDPAVLTLEAAAIDPAFAVLPGANVLVNDTAAGRAVLSWTLTTGESDRNGAFASLSFRIAEDAPGGVYPLMVSCIGGNIFNQALNDVPFAARNGSVTVSAPPRSDAAVIMESVSGSAGDTVDAALLLSGNPGVSSLVFTVEYDPAALTLQSTAIDAAFAALPGATVLVNDLAAGRVVLSWALTAGEVALDGAFAHLSFRIAEDAAGVYPLAVSYRPGNVCNEALEDVAFAVVTGSVTVEAASPSVPFAEFTACTDSFVSASAENLTEQSVTCILAAYDGSGRMIASTVRSCAAGQAEKLAIEAPGLADAKLFLLGAGGMPIMEALHAAP